MLLNLGCGRGGVWKVLLNLGWGRGGVWEVLPDFQQCRGGVFPEIPESGEPQMRSGLGFDWWGGWFRGGTQLTAHLTLMIRLARLLKNPFTRKGISFDELVACGTDTQHRFIANNPGGIYNAVINNLTVALVTVGNCATDDIVKLGLRKSAKSAKDSFRSVLPAQLGTLEAKVAGHYGYRSDQVKQLFPSGRDIFNTCADDAVDDHLSAVLTALNALAPAMGATGVDAQGLASSLLSNWIALYAASETSSGNKTTTEMEKRSARQNLAAKLHLALLAVATQAATLASSAGKAITDAEAEAALALYFRQDLLGELPAEEEEDDDEEPAPAPGPTP